MKVVSRDSILPLKKTTAVAYKTIVIKEDTATIKVFIGERLFCDYNILIGTITL